MTRGPSRRRCLLVTADFPPSSSTARHRARYLARHLPSQGWDVEVLAPCSKALPTPHEPMLCSLIPRGVRVHRVHATPVRLARSLGIGDGGLRAWIGLRARLRRLLRAGRFDAVLVTMGSFYPAVPVAAAARAHGVPFVLDYQDPWVSPWGAEQPFLSKAGLSQAIGTRLEPGVVRDAAAITAVSEGTIDLVRSRYSWSSDRPTRALPIGGDRADFELLSGFPARSPWPRRTEPTFRLIYPGTFLPKAALTMRCFLRALRRFAASARTRVEVLFLGTSNQTKGRPEPRVTGMAREEGVADLVVERPLRVPYLQALQAILDADGVLVIGSSEPHYTASKLFPALFADRRVLLFAHAGSSAVEAARRVGGTLTVTFEDARSIEDRVDPLVDGLNVLLLGSAMPPVDRRCLSEFSAASIASGFAAVLDAVVGSSHPAQAARSSRPVLAGTGAE